LKVTEREGPRGGLYFEVFLTDGRRMTVTQTKSDNRVWLGGPNDSYYGQRGGTGKKIPQQLDEWRSQMAHDPEAEELYRALRALVKAKQAHG